MRSAAQIASRYGSTRGACIERVTCFVCVLCASIKKKSQCRLSLAPRSCLLKLRSLFLFCLCLSLSNNALPTTSRACPDLISLYHTPGAFHGTHCTLFHGIHCIHPSRRWRAARSNDHGCCYGYRHRDQVKARLDGRRWPVALMKEAMDLLEVRPPRPPHPQFHEYAQNNRRG